MNNMSNPNSQQTLLHNYLFDTSNLLGKGTFGSVYSVINTKNNQNCAAKKISKRMVIERNLQQQLKNEMCIHRQIKHPNIVEYYDQFSTNEDIFIVLEKCNSETLEKISCTFKSIFERDLSLKVIQHFMKQIINAVGYLHSQGIMHRDLKLENIMLRFDNEEPVTNRVGYFYYNNEYMQSWEKFEDLMMTASVKIIDLGFAKQLDISNGYTSSFLGTPAFVAPEILKKKTSEDVSIRYTSKVDSWSVGVIAFLLLTGRYPFDISSNVKTFKDLFYLQKDGTYYIEGDTILTFELVDLVNGLLQFNDMNRFSCMELSNHPFLKRDLNSQKQIKADELASTSGHFSGGIKKNLVLTAKERTEFINGLGSFSSNDKEVSEASLFDSIVKFRLPVEDELDKLFNIFTSVTIDEKQTTEGFTLIDLVSVEKEKDF